MAISLERETSEIIGVVVDTHINDDGVITFRAWKDGYDQRHTVIAALDPSKVETAGIVLHQWNKYGILPHFTEFHEGYQLLNEGCELIYGFGLVEMSARAVLGKNAHFHASWWEDEYSHWYRTNNVMSDEDYEQEWRDNEGRFINVCYDGIVNKTVHHVGRRDGW